MLLVKNPVQLLQGCVQVDFVKCIVGGIFHWIPQLDLALENLGLQASKSCHTNNGSERWSVLIEEPRIIPQVYYVPIFIDDRQLIKTFLVHDFDGLINAQFRNDAQGSIEFQG